MERKLPNLIKLIESERERERDRERWGGGEIALTSLLAFKATKYCTFLRKKSHFVERMKR